MPRKPAQKRKSSSKKRAKKKAQLYKTLSIVSVFFISLLMLSGFFIYKRLTVEFASAFSSSSYNILNEDIYTTALIKVDSFNSEPSRVDEISVFIFDKSTLKVVKYVIPVDVEVDVPGRFGMEPLSNIFALGSMSSEHFAESADLISKALFKKLAFPVDRYIVVEDSGYAFVSGLFKGGLNIPTGSLDILELKKSLKTNLSLRELVDVYSFTSSLPKDRIIEKKYVATFEENPKLLDEELRDITFDTDFANEVKSISILNGSELSGVATVCSRIIKNLGGRVVAVGNTDREYAESVIIVNDTTSESLRTLRNVFNIEKVIMHSDAGDYSESEINRSDITVILGLDFAKSM